MAEKVTEKATHEVEKANAANPRVLHGVEQGNRPQEHGPSQPDQASASEMEASRPAFRGVEVPADQQAEADNNPIEKQTRQMATDGATAGEIAAYRADALAKLGE